MATEKDDKQTGDTTIDKGRRRISKAVAASPIMASLASPSVWGGYCSVSGLDSGNTSRTGDEVCQGRGCTPGYWKNHPDAWPPGFSPGVCKDGYTSGKGNCKSWTYTGCTEIGEILGGHHVSDFGSKYRYQSNSTPIMYILQREVNGGGDTNSQLSHWIAAIFNAIVAPDIYGTSPVDLLIALDKTYDSNNNYNFSDLLAVLKRMNEAGPCFLSGGSGSADITCNPYNGTEFMYFGPTGTCIPSCPEGQAYDWDTKTCVPMNTETSYEDWCAANPSTPECSGDWLP